MLYIKINFTQKNIGYTRTGKILRVLSY